jgi:DNA-binding transcriptional MerR regulator
MEGNSGCKGELNLDNQLTIKQVSTILQSEISTIRFWEKEFAEYMAERSYKGQRKRFSEHDLEVLSKIKELLQTEMYTIKGAKRRLELEKTLSVAMGVDQSFKTTVFFMFSSIMQELQGAREESRELAKQILKLEQEKSDVVKRLDKEKNKSFIEFLKNKIQKEKIDKDNSILVKGMKERLIVKSVGDKGDEELSLTFEEESSNSQPMSNR